MSSFNFVVEGDAVPQPRPRVVAGGAYYPERARGSKRLSYPDYKDLVRTSYRSQFIHWLNYKSSSVDFSLKVRVFFRGKGLGDVNSLLGTIMDALEGSVWANDRQVSKATVERFYNDPHPRVEIGIEEVR